MKIAIPTRDNNLCPDLHFCEKLTIFIVKEHRIESEKCIENTSNNIQDFPDNLIKLGVDMIITGKIKSEINELLHRRQISTITGAPKANPRILVEFYILQN